ncbi:MAG: tetratricopeptide repeat protein [Flavobacteriales bacterium]|nr:tetratricopeptide repeat protein [Flavobacteriales bacterium]
MSKQNSPKRKAQPTPAKKPVRKAPPIKSSAKKSLFPHKAKIRIGAPSEAISIVLRKFFWGSAAILFVLMSIMSQDYGISGDEVDMNEYGKSALGFYTSLGKDTSSFAMQIDRDKAFKYYGVAFDATAALLNKISPLEEYNTRHLLNSWTGWLSMLLAGLIAARIAGWRAALIALWALFLSPRFLGHSMNNPKDIPFALSFMLATWGFVRLMDEMPKPTKSTYALIIGGIGLSIGSRIGGLMLYGYLGLFLGLHFVLVFRKGGKLLNYLKVGLLSALGSYALGMLLWPYGLLDPINHPLQVLERVSNLPISIRQLFEGKHIASDALPLHYLPKYLLISNPLVILAGVLLFAALAWAAYKRYDGRKLFIIGFGFAFPIAYILYKDSNVYGGWRHVLFTYPYLLLLAALGWETLLRLLQSKAIVQKVAFGILLIGFFPVVAWTVRSHPYQYTYFNELVGGTDGAYGKYETDYYYNSAREASEWLIDSLDLQPGDSIVLASNCPNQLKAYFRDFPKIRHVYTHYYERNNKDWEYAIYCNKTVNTAEIMNGNYPPVGTIHEVKRGKAVLGVAMKRPSRGDFNAVEALKQNDVATALVETRSYLQTDPNNVDVLNQLADIYVRINQLDSAQVICTRGLGLFPTHVGLQFNQAIIYMQQENTQAAIATLQKLLKERDNIFSAHYYLAYNYSLTGQLPKAIESANKAIGYNPGFKPAYQLAAQCFRQLNQPDNARQYEEAAARLP